MANIRIVQGITTVNGSSENSTVQSGIITDQLCTVTLVGATPTGFAWVLTPPLNADDVISGVSAAAPTFTPSKRGIYLLSLNGIYTLPFLVESSAPNVYAGPIVPAALTAVAAPVPAAGTSIISDSANVGSLLTTDLNGRQAPVAMVRKGTTGQRPTSPAVGLYVGFTYFDTTLTKPIWWSGSAWVDSTGASV